MNFASDKNRSIPTRKRRTVSQRLTQPIERRKGIVAIGIALILGLLIMTNPTFAQVDLTFDTVAFTGLDAPDVPGANYDTLQVPTISDNGQILFQSLLDGIGVELGSNEGVFSGTSDSISLVVREGDLPPGFAGTEVFTDFNHSRISASGQTVFVGTIANSVVDFGIFSDASGVLESIALAGQSIPGAVGVDFLIFNALDSNESGQTAFLASLSGQEVNASNNRAFFFADNQSLDLIARQGDPAPGTPPGTSFEEINVAGLNINDAGTVAFYAELSGAERGIFVWNNGVLEPLVLSGDEAPGTPLGVNFNPFDELDLNEAGEIAFLSILTDGSQGVFSDAGGAIELVALSGEQAAGLAPNKEYFNFQGITINDVGDTAFIADLEGLGVVFFNDQAIYAQQDGTLQLIARQGDPAPGTEAGVLFGDFQKLSFNNNGQLVFATSLFGDGSIDDVVEAIYVCSEGEFALVARVGDMFDVDDDPLVDDLREVAQISIAFGSDSTDANEQSLNNEGELVFGLHFTDANSGVFMATIEPQFVLGDVNGDGSVNLLDVAPFVDALTSGVFNPAADINGDGIVNLLDVAPFVDLLTM